MIDPRDRPVAITAEQIERSPPQRRGRLGKWAREEACRVGDKGLPAVVRHPFWWPIDIEAAHPPLPRSQVARLALSGKLGLQRKIVCFWVRHKRHKRPI